MPSRLPHRLDASSPTGRSVVGRRQRSGDWHWNVLVGVFLIGSAVWFVAGSEPPVAGDLPEPSAEPVVVLLPEPLSPLGEARHEGLRFEWLWEGPETLWELVLLDAALERLVTVRDIAGNSLVPRGELLERLRAGGHFHWFVSYSTEGQSFHSLPVPLTLPERRPGPR